MQELDFTNLTRSQIKKITGEKVKKGDGGFENLNIIQQEFPAIKFEEKDGIFFATKGDNPEFIGEVRKLHMEQALRVISNLKNQYMLKNKNFSNNDLNKVIKNIKENKPGSKEAIENDHGKTISIKDTGFVKEITKRTVTTIIKKNFNQKLNATGDLANVIMLPMDTEADNQEDMKSTLAVINYFKAAYESGEIMNLTIHPKDVQLAVTRVKNGEPLVFSPRKEEDLTFYTPKLNVVPQPGQEEAIRALKQNKAYTFLRGGAGSGKTFLAVACAVSAVRSGKYKRIIITRPFVQSGADMGFLPGGQKEKMDPYLQPIYDALNDVLSEAEYDSWVSKKIIDIAPLAFLRGRTINGAVIIGDEFQNAVESQIDLVNTRVGKTSRVILTGDLDQIDLQGSLTSGWDEMLDFMDGAEHAVIVNIKTNCRHPAVAEYLERKAKRRDELAENRKTIIHLNPSQPPQTKQQDLLNMAQLLLQEAASMNNHQQLATGTDNAPVLH